MRSRTDKSRFDTVRHRACLHEEATQQQKEGKLTEEQKPAPMVGLIQPAASLSAIKQLERKIIKQDSEIKSQQGSLTSKNIEIRALQDELGKITKEFDDLLERCKVQERAEIKLKEDCVAGSEKAHGLIRSLNTIYQDLLNGQTIPEDSSDRIYAAIKFMDWFVQGAADNGPPDLTGMVYRGGADLERLCSRMNDLELELHALRESKSKAQENEGDSEDFISQTRRRFLQHKKRLERLEQRVFDWQPDSGVESSE